jgi:hypothetical protein
VTHEFKRTYAVEIVFDTPITFAEQDRLACVVLEKLVDDWWDIAQQGTQQGNMPVEVVAYPIENKRATHALKESGGGVEASRHAASSKVPAGVTSGSDGVAAIPSDSEERAFMAREYRHAGESFE